MTPFVNFLVRWATGKQLTNGPPSLGVWQTLLRTSLVDNGRVPKDTAGRGLTSTLWPRNFEEEEPWLEDKSENDLRMPQAGPGRRPCEMKISRTGLGRRWVRLEYLGLGQASARDSTISPAGPGGRAGPARPIYAPLVRVGSTGKNRLT